MNREQDREGDREECDSDSEMRCVYSTIHNISTKLFTDVFVLAFIVCSELQSKFPNRKYQNKHNEEKRTIVAPNCKSDANMQKQRSALPIMILAVAADIFDHAVYGYYFCHLRPFRLKSIP